MRPWLPTTWQRPEWPRVWKILLPGAASLSVIGVLAAVSVVAIGSQARRVDTVVHGALENAVFLGHVRAELSNEARDLYRTLAEQNAMGRGSEEASHIAERLDALSREVKTRATTTHDPQDARSLNALAAEIDRQKDAVAFMASMLQIDLAAADSFLPPYAAAQTRADALTAQVIARTDAHARALAAESVASVNHAVGLVIAMAAIAALVSCGLGFFMGRIQSRQSLVELALQNMSHGVCMFDRRRVLRFCNQPYLDLYRLPSDGSLIGKDAETIVGHFLSSGILRDNETMKAAMTQLAALDKSGPRTFLWELSTGQQVEMSLNGMADGGFYIVHRDVTESHLANEQIQHLAYHDALTGLSNRLHFQEKLDAGLQARQDGGSMAVLCFDIDHFNIVNETMGHDCGDGLLQQVAVRLTEAIQPGDFAARLGGDEFGVIMSGSPETDDIVALADRLTDSLKTPYMQAGSRFDLSVTLGIAVAPDDGLDSTKLLKNANLALASGKLEARGEFRFFDVEMDARMQRRRAMEADLKEALETDAFELHYQPLLDLRTGQVKGAEALIRWNHPERGRISPAEFIPLAEETGLIIGIGDWVLRRACRDAAAWPEALTVAVNLSPIQFQSETLGLNLVSALHQSGLTPSRLELEITEAVMIRDTDAALRTLHQLRALGVRVAMDDFGTGYSSLGYLRRFPFDKIKIDQSFVRDIEHDKGALAIVRTVTQLGKNLGMTTLAEGIETEAQLNLLKKEGCNMGQGYFFSRPVPLSAFSALITGPGVMKPNANAVSISAARVNHGHRSA